MRLLEGMVGASAKHPNIVETYRVVMQLAHAPSAPALVLAQDEEVRDFAARGALVTEACS